MAFSLGHPYGRRFAAGDSPWNKGDHVLKTWDEKHWKWKGDKVGLGGLHNWVRRRLGKASYCSFDRSHKSTRYHWANISKEYHRDINDFMSLCPSCHFRFDNIGKKMWKTRKKE